VVLVESLLTFSIKSYKPKNSSLVFFSVRTNALGHVRGQEICMHKTVDKNAKAVVFQASDHTTGLQLFPKILVLVSLSFINM